MKVNALMLFLTFAVVTVGTLIAIRLTNPNPTGNPNPNNPNPDEYDDEEVYDNPGDEYGNPNPGNPNPDNPGNPNPDAEFDEEFDVVELDPVDKLMFHHGGEL